MSGELDNHSILAASACLLKVGSCSNDDNFVHICFHTGLWLRTGCVTNAQVSVFERTGF